MWVLLNMAGCPTCWAKSCVGEESEYYDLKQSSFPTSLTVTGLACRALPPRARRFNSITT